MPGIATPPAPIMPPPAAPPTVAPRTITEPSPPQSAQTGVRIATGTICMWFAALTSAMVVRQGAAPDWRHFQLPQLLYVNTLVLLASSGTLEWSRRRIAAVSVGAPGLVPRLDGLAGVYLTLALGLLFVSGQVIAWRRSEEHTSELQSRLHLVCRLLLEKKKNIELHTQHTSLITTHCSRSLGLC